MGPHGQAIQLQEEAERCGLRQGAAPALITGVRRAITVEATKDPGGAFNGIAR